MTERTRTWLVTNATWADQARATKNFHRNEALGLRTTANNAYAYLYVPLPDALRRTGVTLVSAWLGFYAKDNWSSTNTFTVKRPTERVSYSRLTWAKKPAVGAGSAVSPALSIGGDGTLVEVDVTSLMTSGLGVNWHGFRLEKSGVELRHIYSPFSGNPDREPYVRYEWTTNPAAPVDLSPAGNRHVSIAKPVVRAYDGWPEDSDGQIDAFNVQINATDVWTAPTFDSGTVVTTDPELDLSTTAYAGLSAGSSTFWRCRVRVDGNWSLWSAGTQFARTDKPVLTITNPAAAPNNFVTEWTPPFSWTFTGQKDFQAALSHADRPDKVLHDSGWVTSTAVSYTPPPGILTREGTNYVLEVRTRDAVDREATPGDPAFVRATRQFTFAESAVPAPVTGLTVTQHSVYPDMLADFTRTTAPDSFTLLRKIDTDPYEVVEDGIVPSDVLVSGTSYQIRDRTARPNCPLTYKVQAVVNNAASTGNPTGSITLVQEGIWLTDLDQDIRVHIAGDEGVDLLLGESSAVYTPPAGGQVVLVSQGLRGYQGTVSGFLVPLGGVAAATWEARLRLIRERPEALVRLSLGDINLRGWIQNVTVRPSNDPFRRERACSFDFYQR